MRLPPLYKEVCTLSVSDWRLSEQESSSQRCYCVGGSSPRDRPQRSRPGTSADFCDTYTHFFAIGGTASSDLANLTLALTEWRHLHSLLLDPQTAETVRRLGGYKRCLRYVDDALADDEYLSLLPSAEVYGLRYSTKQRASAVTWVWTCKSGTKDCMSAHGREGSSHRNGAATIPTRAECASHLLLYSMRHWGAVLC